jgi:hypothetical protein
MSLHRPRVGREGRPPLRQSQSPPPGRLPGWAAARQGRHAVPAGHFGHHCARHHRLLQDLRLLIRRPAPAAAAQAYGQPSTQNDPSSETVSLAAKTCERKVGPEHRL